MAYASLWDEYEDDRINDYKEPISIVHFKRRMPYNEMDFGHKKSSLKPNLGCHSGFLCRGRSKDFRCNDYTLNTIINTEPGCVFPR
jgi:hypothetical protein